MPEFRSSALSAALHQTCATLLPMRLAWWNFGCIVEIAATRRSRRIRVPYGLLFESKPVSRASLRYPSTGAKHASVHPPWNTPEEVNRPHRISVLMGRYQCTTIRVVVIVCFCSAVSVRSHTSSKRGDLFTGYQHLICAICSSLKSETYIWFGVNILKAKLWVDAGLELEGLCRCV